MGNRIKSGVFFIAVMLVLAIFALYMANAQTASQNYTTNESMANAQTASQNYTTNESQNLPGIDYVQTTAHDLLTGKINAIPGGVDTTNLSSNYRPSPIV